MSKIKIEENATEKQLVGILDQKYIDIANANILTGEIYMYPGAIKHMKKNHPKDFQQYFKYIPFVIESPDYVGQNPTEKNSIELVKVINGEILVAIKLDPTGYLYLSSAYLLTPAKIPKRLKSGRLKEVNP